MTIIPSLSSHSLIQLSKEDRFNKNKKRRLKKKKVKKRERENLKKKL